MEGDIFLSGENLSNKKEKRLEQIAMVFQNPSPFPFSIYKNMTSFSGAEKKSFLPIPGKRKPKNF